MGINSNPSGHRLKSILDRQDEPKFGQHYVPSILATREELPRLSFGSQIYCQKLNRVVHALSRAERDIAILAMSHPKIFDFHEQKMLAMFPRQHPLVGHEKALERSYPMMRGTLNITKELGLIKNHPIIYEKGARLPFPWIGDFLLFLEDENGPYCVNWTIKANEESFEHSDLEVPIGKTPNLKIISKYWLRQTVEELLYEEVGIPTRRITPAIFGAHVLNNLRQLWLSQKIENKLNQADEEIIIGCLLEAIQKEVPLNELVLHLEIKLHINHENIKAVIFNTIRSGLVKIDFNKPLVFNSPLVTSKDCIWNTYSELFKRG